MLFAGSGNERSWQDGWKMRQEFPQNGPGPIIATASSETAAGAAKAARAALAMGASRAEIRLDILASEGERHKAVELASEIPLLVSGDRIMVRPDEWPHFKRASELGAWIDLPAEGAPDNLPGQIAPSRLILSWHGRPGERKALSEVTERMRQKRAAAYKVVPFADDENGNLQARDLLSSRGSLNDLIVFASGSSGVLSRILAIAWGSLATYASAPGCAPAGEGQPSLDLLLSCAPLEIKSSTPLIALLGWPLQFSKTPSFFNRWLREADRPERYVLFPLKELKDFARLARDFNLLGAAVTIPHKQAAMKEAAFHSRLAMATGAANTLLKRPEGWMAANTDVYGVRSAVKRPAAPRPRTLLLGSGGAAAAAAMALCRRGPVAVCARDSAKAGFLASRFNCETVPWEERENAKWDLLVNATPLGLREGESPMFGERLKCGAILDMVIPREGETTLVKAARHQGVRVFHGETMLEAQARLQFRLFAPSP
jgi:shikimate dehydrogenase